MADALYRDPAYREAMRRWEARMAHTAPFEPEHRTCNRSAGASDGNRARGTRRWSL